MGMRFTLVMVPPDGIAGLAQDEDRLMTLITDPKPPSGLDIDKAWHGIHYLLTGETSTSKGPFGAVILGGQDVGPDLGYGPPRFLTISEVAEISKALNELPADQFRRRFDPKAMDTADVYPQIWKREGAEGLDWLQSAFQELVAFYRRAATQRMAVILALL
jgi:hypothetical protein